MYNFKLFDYQFEVSDNISICKDAIHILDYNKLPQVIQIRTRANGDIFAKFGTGKKKLKEYLIDIKIPKRKRDELLLITNDNNILCVLGCEISENVKYDNTTKLYLIVKKLS